MTIVETLWTALIFFAPAGIANMAPVFAAKLPVLKHWTAPLDCGLFFRGKRLLGDNKTWRGLICGTLAAMLFALLLQSVTTVEFGPALLVGALQGFGALFGDAFESIVKRQVGIAPGKSWFPFDQLDFIVFGLLFSYPVTNTPVSVMAGVVVVYFGLHLLAGFIAYHLKLKSEPI